MNMSVAVNGNNLKNGDSLDAEKRPFIGKTFLLLRET